MLLSAAEEDISSAGVWPLLSNLEDPELRHLAAGLPAIVLRSQADGTTRKYRGAYQRWERWAGCKTRSTRFHKRYT